MHYLNKHAYLNVFHFFIDIVVIIISYLLSFWIASRLTTLYSISTYTWIFIAHIPIWLFSMNNYGMYNDTTFKYYDRVIRNILFSSFFSLIIVAAMIFFIKQESFSRLLFLCFAIVSTVFLIAEHFVYTFVIRKKIAFKKNIIIVGDDDVLDRFTRYLNKTDIPYQIIARIPLCKLNTLQSIIADNIVDQVFFTFSKNKIDEIEENIDFCEEMGLTASVIVDFFEHKTAPRCYVNCIGPMPVLTFHTVCLNKQQLFIKRFIDILGSIVGLIFTSLISLILIPLIRIDSKGPALFAQDRVGVNGRVFKLYKFRTMIVDAEEQKKALLHRNEMSNGYMFKIKNDPRITRVGKFLRATSLDEFPQFINVFKGDMSLVGTRPPTVDEVAQYKNWHWRRISIKPGITGMWQANGRSQITDFDEVVRLDTAYIDNWSVFLDLKILIKTILVIFLKKGAM